MFASAYVSMYICAMYEVRYVVNDDFMMEQCLCNSERVHWFYLCARCTCNFIFQHLQCPKLYMHAIFFC